ncbi:3-carboxy-cis,cis-muconate cycloisomerase [Streptomyces sp. V2]|uniref:3-carboxy-cis,cis-muconate cycloisomerase n=1 Tax=Streptomyces TaxID=1883 RepID=UPI000D66BD8A|nr:3-carboxy-cis,cis-muconate cycloisomerase [Streptomyces sp. V2]PWG10079.1 3-carboxy-cis,cis-muconate cycloisomerase [Streptomyces sp. V2]
MAEHQVGLDTGLLSPVRAGLPVERAVSDEAWIQAMLDAEAALARAQARLGGMPATAAEAITATADAGRFDARALALAARETANPVVGLVRELGRLVAERDPAAAEHVHRGSTSQDIFDTGAMLVARRALALIRADLARTAAALAGLAARHRDTPMAGRTLALHAVPTTFGLKAAGWLESVRQADHRLAGTASALPVSLGGAAGTLAGYLEHARLAGACADPGDYADRLLDAFATETGLARPALPWHALRAPLADLGAALAFTTGALGKIAVDVQALTRTETGEVTEPAVTGRGGSSAMPHKRNPVLATLIRSAALQVPAMAGALTQCLVTEDERAAGVWHAEWLLTRECLRLAGGAAHTAAELADGLVVNPGRMRTNLGLTGSRLVSERVAAVLSPLLGRDRARQILTETCASAERDGVPLHTALGALPEVAAHLDAGELATLLDPTAYTGAAGPLVDRALSRAAPPGPSG